MVDLNELIEQLRGSARPCDILEAADTIEALRTALSKAEARIVELSGMLGGTTIRHVLNDRKALESSLAEAKRLLKPLADAKGHFDGHVRDEDTVEIALRNIRAHHVRAAARFLSQESNQ
jgi:ABC-type transporter Mla subunit MlaD